MNDTFLGMRIVESPFLPARVGNVVLTHRVQVSDGFRREFQAWLDDFFGTHAVAYIFDPAALGWQFMGDKLIGINPQHGAMLKVLF